MKNALIRIRHQNSKKRLLAMASDWYAAIHFLYNLVGVSLMVLISSAYCGHTVVFEYWHERVLQYYLF